MIIKHYEAFQTKLKSTELNQENWDILRTESAEMAFAIEGDIESYERNCIDAKAYEESARNIIKVLKKYGCGHVVSLGCGKGILEWHLKKQMPELRVECTDYAAASVEKLKKVFTQCDGFYCFDIMNGNYTALMEGEEETFFVLYRVSEEFSYEEWCKVFCKMHEEGVHNIIYVPDMIATEELAQWMERRHNRHIEKGLESTFCGWIYSEDTMEEIFTVGQYHIAEKQRMGDLIMYLLTDV